MGFSKPSAIEVSLDLAGFASGEGVTRIDPLDLNPYLYFAADTNISTSGGAVSTWYSQWYGTSGPSNGRSEYLTQSTTNRQPAHDSSDKHVTFDVVSSIIVDFSSIALAAPI